MPKRKIENKSYLTQSQFNAMKDLADAAVEYANAHRKIMSAGEKLLDLSQRYFVEVLTTTVEKEEEEEKKEEKEALMVVKKIAAIEKKTKTKLKLDAPKKRGRPRTKNI